MSISVYDQILDTGLAGYSGCTDIAICSAVPTDFLSATINLGQVTVQPFSAPAPATGGRAVTTVVVNGVVKTSGTAIAWAALDVPNSRLLATGTIVPMPAVAAQLWSLGSFTIAEQYSDVRTCTIPTLTLVTVGLNLQTPQLMTYRNQANPASWQNLRDFLGHDLPIALDFATGGPGVTWPGMTGSVNSMCGRYPNWRLCVSLPPITGPGVTFANVAAGTYDSYFITMATNLIKWNHGNTIIRLGVEFNGGWFSWTPNNGVTGMHVTDWIACWKHIHDVFMAQTGAAFEWFFCPALTSGHVAADICYPGDAYVDYIGGDCYWQRWLIGSMTESQIWNNEMLNNAFGLKWAAAFAAAHGKKFAIGEAGSGYRPDGHGGGDSSYFWTQLVSFMQANNGVLLGIWNVPASDVHCQFTLASNYTGVAPADWRDDKIHTTKALRHLFSGLPELPAGAVETNAPSGLTMVPATGFDNGAGALKIPIGTAKGTIVGQLNAVNGQRLIWCKEIGSGGSLDNNALAVDQHTGVITTAKALTALAPSAVKFSCRNTLGGIVLNTTLEVA